MKAVGPAEVNLPQAVEAEQQVIGSLLLAPELISEVSKVVRVGDFVDPAHRAAFGVIMALHRAGDPVDAVAVAQKLRTRCDFPDSQLAAAYLAETGRAVATAAHAGYYAKQIRQAADKSRLYRTIVDAAPQALNGKPALEVCNDLRSDLEDFGRNFVVDAKAVDSTEAFDEWAASVLGREKPRMFLCGPAGSRLRDLEIGAGMITTLAAPPSKGKSALAHQLLFDALLQPGQENLRVLIASVEMLPGQILNRQLARFSGIGHGYIRHRTYDRDATDRIEASIEELRQLMPRIAFMEPPFSVERAVETAEAFEADVVLLDYLQRFAVEGAGDDARLQVNRAMTLCRQLADQGRAVLVVSAVNRQGYQKETAGLASLRESGELEYASDSVYLLHLDDPQGHGERAATLKCHKARDAELAEIPMTFNPSRMQFEAAPQFAPHAEFETDDDPGECDPWQ